MVRCPQLPEIAVQQIVRAARGRNIPGTNKYARVCRQWRDVSEEGEPLQLFMNLSHLANPDLSDEDLSEEDLDRAQNLDRATTWLSTYGQHVEALVIEAGMCMQKLLHVDLVASIAPGLANLRRLEVTGDVSLFEMAPYFQHLPQLQHLGAEVSFGGHARLPGYSPRKHGNSSGSQSGWQGLPDMQQLCPQLTSLDLTLQVHADKHSAVPDLSWLVIPGLQQLTLIDKYSAYTLSAEIHASSLAHLSALRHLTLEGVVLRADQREVAEWQGTDEQKAQGLGALQELRVYHPHSDLDRDCDLVHLANKLVDYEVRGWGFIHISVLTSYVHLTRLVLTSMPRTDVAAVLPALTALQELGLQGCLQPHVVGVVQQAAGMAQLRSLQLDGLVDDVAEVVSCLAHCTQLTSLGLLVFAHEEPVSEPPYIVALQQLTGLRCLTVHGQLLLCQQGSGLAALTQLTSLCVKLSDDEEKRARYQAAAAGVGALHYEEAYPATAQWLLGQVQPWPPQLQQVMFEMEHCVGYTSILPKRWHFAAAPGGVQVTAWLEECDQSAPRWARPLRPCPHLLGVWELQGLTQGRPWRMVTAPTLVNG